MAQTWTTGDLSRKISSIPYRNAGKRIEYFHVFKAGQPRDLLNYFIKICLKNQEPFFEGRTVFHVGHGKK